MDARPRRSRASTRAASKRASTRSRCVARACRRRCGATRSRGSSRASWAGSRAERSRNSETIDDQPRMNRLDIQPKLVEDVLVRFLRVEAGKFGFTRAVLGLSGGVDSAVSCALAARAFGPKNVLAVM